MTEPQPPHRTAEAVQTVIRFFRCLDESDYGGLCALMLPEGVWHRRGKALQGEAAIRGAMAERSPTRRIAHLLTNAFAVPAADGAAEVTCYMLVVQHDSGAPPAGPSPLQGIENIRTVRARLRATAEGWRIERLGSGEAIFAR